MTMHRKHSPRIRLVNGEWYAFGKSGRLGRLALVPAINFVRLRNASERRCDGGQAGVKT
jgi:hypothetical protein